MIFLISNKNDVDIFCTNNIKLAKEFVFNEVEEAKGLSFGIYGAKNRELFLLLYPEFKGRYFVSI